MKNKKERGNRNVNKGKRKIFFLHKEDGSKSDKYGSKIEYKTKVVVFLLTVLKKCPSI